MEHCFKYNHKGRDFHFLWDVESGSLHNVDSVAYLVAKNKYDKLSQTEMQQFAQIPCDVVQEI